VTSVLRSATKTALFNLGHYRRQIQRREFPGVAVLSYHGIRESNDDEESISLPWLHLPAREFEAHCSFIREACNPISLGQWRDSVNGGPPLPTRPVLLTFDDGYRSVLTVAHRILSKYEIPAVAFVATEAVERRELLWFDAVDRSHGEKTVDSMKHVPFDERLIRTRACATTVNGEDPNAPLSVEEVRLLVESGLFEIGAHTMSHLMLTQADPQVQATEIRGSKEKLESWIGRQVHAFAYPNGDYTDETVTLVREAGYSCAFTAKEGFSPRGCMSFAMPRFFVMRSLGVAELAHRLTYSWRNGS
jgi:peptidoglycan/xylan/chitin deacetylase (PgdA/CDA1 family)